MRVTATMHSGTTGRAWGLAAWLLVFLSPSVWLLLVLLGDRFGATPPPDRVMEALFLSIPIAALAICCAAVWAWGRTVLRKIGWTLLTVLGMAGQCGLIVAVLALATAG